MSSQAHELNVRTSRRLLIERSTAELLSATCLGVTANAESNRGPLDDCSSSALPLSYSPRRTQTPRQRANRTRGPDGEFSPPALPLSY
jgi:hypothetical protein